MPTSTLPGSQAWDDGFVKLYQERYEAMVRLAYLLTGARSVAEEIVQEAFLATHRLWETVERPVPYLRMAVANRARSWARRQRVERLHQPAPGPDAELHADELWDALATLKDRQRAAIVFRFYEDLPDEEIAELLGCRPTTVRTAIHRGLAVLKREIER